MRNLSRIAVSVLALGALVAPTAAQKGGNPNPGIVPVNSSTHGLTYGQWAGAWWNWALQFPWDTSPLNPDDTGEWTMQGQRGPVFFLAGTSGGPAERSVTIDPGKSIFFPIVNYVAWAPDDEPTEELLRARAHNRMDPYAMPGAISCTLDGREVNKPATYRAESPAGGFRIDLPANNLFGLAPWVRDLAVADGYWLMLTPLTPGAHTLRFTADGPVITLDVTYHITVPAPGNQ